MSPLNPRALAAVLGAILTLGVVPVAVELAVGEDFLVENKVFFGSGKKAASRSTTIFHNGLVYDYLDRPAEVIVFDKAAGRFTLLDTVRRVRAELAAGDVADLTRRLQQSAEAHPDPFIKFLADPKFREQFDETAQELTLSSQWLTYRVVLAKPGSPAIAAQYREFADWYARLNTMLNPGSKPPMARLLVNAALAKRGAIAGEVYRTTASKTGSPPKRTTIRSQHRLIRRVAAAELERITQTRRFMEAFKPVSFEQYRRTADR